MMRVRVLTPEGLKVGGEELLHIAGMKWVDVIAPDRPLLDRLASQFGLHALAIEDCLHLDQRPKLEEYPGHHFIVLHGFSCLQDKLESLTLNELHLFLGPDWLISIHDGEITALQDVIQKLDADPTNTLARGVDFTAYLLADALIDANFPLMDCFNDELEQLQDDMFSHPNQKLLHRSFALKRQLVQLRRVMSPQRDVVGLLSRSGISNVSERTTLYFRDIYDHLIRLYEQIESARDMLSNIMEAYLSVVANRTNEIMRQLTVFSSIFLPLGFIVGFFGQNFDQLTGPNLIYVMAAAIFSVPLVMLLYFRRRGWF